MSSTIVHKWIISICVSVYAYDKWVSKYPETSAASFPLELCHPEILSSDSLVSEDKGSETRLKISLSVSILIILSINIIVQNTFDDKHFPSTNLNAALYGTCIL